MRKIFWVWLIGQFFVLILKKKIFYWRRYFEWGRYFKWRYFESDWLGSCRSGSLIPSTARRHPHQFHFYYFLKRVFYLIFNTISSFIPTRWHPQQFHFYYFFEIVLFSFFYLIFNTILSFIPARRHPNQFHFYHLF